MFRFLDWFFPTMERVAGCVWHLCQGRWPVLKTSSSRRALSVVEVCLQKSPDEEKEGGSSSDWSLLADARDRGLVAENLEARGPVWTAAFFALYPGFASRLLDLNEMQTLLLAMITEAPANPQGVQDKIQKYRGRFVSKTALSMDVGRNFGRELQFFLAREVALQEYQKCYPGVHVNADSIRSLDIEQCCLFLPSEKPVLKAFLYLFPQRAWSRRELFQNSPLVDEMFAVVNGETDASLSPVVFDLVSIRAPSFYPADLERLREFLSTENPETQGEQRGRVYANLRLFYAEAIGDLGTKGDAFTT